jgi:hypothetical protein
MSTSADMPLSATLIFERIISGIAAEVAWMTQAKQQVQNQSTSPE